MTMPERDELLAAMTDEVAALVLRDNYEQAFALGNARAQAHSLLPVHRRMLIALERERPAQPRARGAAHRRRAGRPVRDAATGCPRPSSRCCWRT